MSELVRLSLSIEKSLLDRLEALVRESGYSNRSEFVRDMIRDQLVRGRWSRDEETIGTVTLLYQHDAHQIAGKLTSIQHDYHHEVVATTHVHLDRHCCLEVIIVEGKASRIERFADELRQQKGVLHAGLSLSSTGEELG